MVARQDISNLKLFNLRPNRNDKQMLNDLAVKNNLGFKFDVAVCTLNQFTVLSCSPGANDCTDASKKLKLCGKLLVKYTS